VSVARALMRLAVAAMPGERQGWARAMAGEFAAAEDEGAGLSFAAGCLLAAWAELPVHAEGRRVIGAYLLALGLMVPLAALLVADTALFPGHVGAGSALVNDGNRVAVPVLAALLPLLGAGQLGLAWATAERDWARVAVLGRWSAAATATLVAFTAVVFRYDTGVLLHAAALGVELAAVAALARREPA
jgi:hypothetical protein